MKNCVAAGPRRAPPHSLMRKKAGIRLNSQNKNQWKKFSAVKEPKRPGFQHQHQREVKPRLMMHAVRGIDRHQRDDGGEHQHQRAQPIDAQVVLDAQRRRPGVLLDQADAAVRGQLASTPPAPAPGRRSVVIRATARACLPAEERNRRARQRQHGQQRQ